MIFSVLGSQRAYLILCLITLFLSSMIIFVVESTNESAQTIILEQSKNISRADFIIESSAPLSDNITQKLGQLERANEAVVSYGYHFNSLVIDKLSNKTAIVIVNAIDEQFPLYGDAIAPVALRENTVFISQSLAQQLGVSIGSYLTLGNVSLMVGEYLYPTATSQFSLSLGSPIYVTLQDAQKSGLVNSVSRIHYEAFVATQNLMRVESELRSSLGEREVLELASEEGVLRGLSEVRTFLTVASTLALLICLLALYFLSSGFIERNRQTIGILKTIGTSSTSIMLTYVSVLSLISLVATCLAAVVGTALLKSVLPLMGVAGFSMSWSVFAITMLSTVVFASVAAIESLRSLVVLKPIEILSSQSNPKKPFLFIFLILIAIVLYLRDVQLSLILCGTLAVLLFLSWLIITVTLFVLRKIVPTIPIVWFTIRSIEYQGKIVMTALFLCTTLVLILAFMGHSLEYSLTQAYPADSPNMFIFDISPEYINGLTLALPNDTLFYPIIRGRLSAINGQAINEEAERNRAGDNLVREFSMTYFDAIPKNEEFVSGNSLFLAQVQNGVSVMDTVAERGSFGVGDTLTFTVGGIAFDAEVTSVRKRTTRTIEPFFYFVFSEQQLRDAPARFFAAIQSNDTSALTSTLALQYPGVGVVDIASLAKIAGKITSYLLLIVTGFMTLTFISCIVLFAALAYGFGLEKKQLVLSARIVGATDSFIRSYIILESILMSAIAGTLAVIVAAVSSHLLLSTVLGLSLEIPWGLTSTILIVSTTLLVVGALLTQQKLLSYKPIEVLKNDA